MLAKYSKIMVVLLALATFTVATDAKAGAQTFKFQTIEIPKAQSTDVLAINNAGVMVGFEQDSGGNYNGVIISGNAVTILSDPDGVAGSTTPVGINNNGAVVGYYTNSTTGNNTGFLYESGTFSDIIFPGAFQTFANGINDSGIIVGDYNSANLPGLGFIYANGVYTSLQVPNSINSSAYGINNFGLVTFSWQDTSLNTESSLYNSASGRYRTIDVPGAVNTNAHHINNHNQVVYSWTDSAGNFHGALLRNGTYYTFDDPSTTTETRADGINDSGVIVGRWEADGGSQFQSFRARFVP